jgi:type II secretory pathway pseudopilin PulG
VVIRKAQGFALIDLVFVCGIIGLLSSIALPRMLLAQQAAGASSAIGSLRTIGSAELTFALTCGSGFYAPSLTALGTPPPGSNDAFLAPTLSAGNSVVRSGYVFQLEGLPFPGSPSPCNATNPARPRRVSAPGPTRSAAGTPGIRDQRRRLDLRAHRLALCRHAGARGAGRRPGPALIQL